MWVATNSGDLEITWTEGKRRSRTPHLAVAVGEARVIIHPVQTLAEVEQTLREYRVLNPEAAARKLWAERPTSLR
jgi:hypothetical protein